MPSSFIMSSSSRVASSSLNQVRRKKSGNHFCRISMTKTFNVCPLLCSAPVRSVVRCRFDCSDHYPASEPLCVTSSLSRLSSEQTILSQVKVNFRSQLEIMALLVVLLPCSAPRIPKSIVQCSLVLIIYRTQYFHFPLLNEDPRSFAGDLLVCLSFRESIGWIEYIFFGHDNE
jgi:hypothetical protein